MNILGIDTTRKKASIFFKRTEREDIYLLALDENVKHSDGLFLYIEKALLDNDVKIEDVDTFACVVGPGSFTGIRVGMSTIKGINKVLKRNIVVMNMFEVLSPTLKTGIVLLNSTSTSCYYAKIFKGEVVESGVVAKVDIEKIADGGVVVVLKEEQEAIGLTYNNYKVVDSLAELYSKCVMQKLDAMQYDEFVPYYLQLSQAERNVDVKD